MTVQHGCSDPVGAGDGSMQGKQVMEIEHRMWGKCFFQLVSGTVAVCQYTSD